MSLITYVTRIHFADGVLEDALAEELRRLGVRRPLIVADQPWSGGEALERLFDALPRRSSSALFVCPAEPDAAVAARAVADLARHDCDVVLGLGGCGAIDLARLVGLTGAAGGALQAMLSGARLAPGGKPAALPVVSIPALPSQGLGLCPALRTGRLAPGDPAEAESRPVIVEAPPPALVLCDPTLGVAAGPEATAAAGIDALTHCIEAFLGTTWNPPADGIALEGVRRAAGNLERAVARGSDLDARRELLAAGLNGGLAAQKGLGGVHALAHALEAEAPAPGVHGALHGALLPVVLGFNAPAVADRFAPIVQAMGLSPGADLPEALSRLGARLALPASLAALGLDAAARDRVARRAEAEAANRTNPRLATVDDYARLLAAAG